MVKVVAAWMIVVLGVSVGALAVEGEPGMSAVPVAGQTASAP